MRENLVLLAEADCVHASVAGAGHDVAGGFVLFDVELAVADLSTAGDTDVLLDVGGEGFAFSGEEVSAEVGALIGVAGHDLVGEGLGALFVAGFVGRRALHGGLESLRLAEVRVGHLGRLRGGRGGRGGF